MKRVSDEQLNVMIGFAADDVAEAPGPLNHCRWLALTELRDRRQAEKKAVRPHDYCGDREPDAPNTAQWADFQCPICGSYYVAQDRFGFRCVAQDCGWTRDVDLTQAEKTIDKDGA